jgi:hypothetical protein
MLIRLNNILKNFLIFINDILYLFLDIFATAYCDSILIYSDILAEHHIYVKSVITIRYSTGLYFIPKKYSFYQ